MNKNLWIITASQIFSFTPAPVNIFLSGIIGSTLSPVKSLQTVPTSSMIVGVAVFSFFAAKIMSKVGRKIGFLYATLFSTLSVLLAAYAVWDKNFYLFCLACFFIGNGISLAVLTFIPFIFLNFYNPESKPNIIKDYKGRSYFELIAQPRFLQAIVSSAFAYAVMSFLMTATPINMHILEHYSLSKTGVVIQLHIMSMFLPSLFTGHLLKKFGHSKMIYTGVSLYVITVLLSFLEPSFLIYIIALVLLGLGWNLLYLSGTSLLVSSYQEEEKFKAQGFNDILVFSIQALASLSAGYVLSMTSWNTMNVIVIPFLILIVFTSIRADLSKVKH